MYVVGLSESACVIEALIEIHKDNLLYSFGLYLDVLPGSCQGDVI